MSTGMLKFYMTPGSCSTGIHILLAELDILYEAHLVNLYAGENNKDDFLALNPKASIPLLITEQGQVISEFQAIAWWLARANPKAELLPHSPDDEIRVLEMMAYTIGHLHGQGFTRIFTGEKYCINRDDIDQVNLKGVSIVDECFKIIDKQLQQQDYLVGSFSINSPC